MLKSLDRLSRIAARTNPSQADLLEACGVVRDALKAEEAYVVRGEEPHFLKVGCSCPPTDYEIKQKGYWLVWRGLAASPGVDVAHLAVNQRIVQLLAAPEPGTLVTHAAMILPVQESNSDMLVIRGPWHGPLPGSQLAFLSAARPMLSLLLDRILEIDRRERLRGQLESLATLADAFDRAADSEQLLTEIATALAKASGMDWVTIVAYNEARDRVLDRAVNIARHSDSDLSSRFKGPPREHRPAELRVGAELAAHDRAILIRDVSEPGLEDRPEIALIRDDIPGLQRFWQRAHIYSVAILPIAVNRIALGHITFSSASSREWTNNEVEYLKALVGQTATALKGLRLYHDLQESREELRKSEERFRSLVQNASDLITVVGEGGEILYQSPSVTQILGYEAEEIVGVRFESLVHPEDAAGLAALAAAANEHGRVGGEVRVRHRDGTWRHVEFIGTDQRGNPSIGGYVLNIRDVGERKALERQLLNQALHDPLTHLLNRRGFNVRLDHAMAEARDQVAVLFMDLDDFKSVNDRLGHAAGDRLLAEIAHRLAECVRPEDTIARLGGDEFAIMLQGTGADEAVRVAARILAALEVPLDLEGVAHSARASIGIAAHAGASGEGAILLRQADLAMYAAKAMGKSCYQVYDPVMLASVLNQLELTSELSTALEEDQLVVLYQPVRSLRSDRLFAFEALVRWKHPRRGLILPDQFVPLAEESGAIIPLGAWVLEQACRDAVTWQARTDSRDCMISVNVSATQVQHPGHADQVSRVLAETGLAPQSLILELTESALVRDPGALLSGLQDLRSLGVKVALDDFSTGYSSLAYMQQFPVDLLKIDRCFVDGLGRTAPELELARVIIEFARALNIEVIAEGIERPDQLERLRALDCSFGQGYLLGRPVSHRNVSRFLPRQRTAPTPDRRKAA